MLGIGMGVYYLSALFSPAAGWLADRLSTRTMLLASNTSRVALLTAYLCVLNSSLEPKVPILLMLAFLIGLAKLPQSSLFRKTFTVLIPANQFLKANGRYGAVVNAAALIGMLASGATIDLIGPNTTLVVSAILFAAFSACIFLLPNVPARAPESIDEKTSDYLSKQWSTFRPFSGYILVLLAMALACTPVQAVLPDAVLSWGLGPSTYSMVLASLTVGSLTGGWLIGKLDDSVSSRRLLHGSIVALATASGLIALVNSRLFILLPVLTFFVGFFACLLESVIYAKFHREVPVESQGFFFAQVGGAETIVEAVGFAVAGSLADIWYTGAPFLFVSVLLLVSTCFQYLNSTRLASRALT